MNCLLGRERFKREARKREGGRGKERGGKGWEEGREERGRGEGGREW